jgi:hypothetical protein
MLEILLNSIYFNISQPECTYSCCLPYGNTSVSLLFAPEDGDDIFLRNFE